MQPSRCNSFPANIRLDKDVLKTSFAFVFRRRLDQDEYIRFSLTSSEAVFKTSSRRLGQDQYIRPGHTSSRRLQDVFQKRLQDIFKTSLRCFKDTLKMSSRHLQDIFKTPSKCFGKTSSRRLAKISLKRFQDVSSS